MRNVHIFCLSALLVVGATGAASAQAPAPPAAQPAAGAQQQAPAGLRAGQKIYSQQGQEIGTIDQVIAGAGGGQVVASVGQFLGLGEKKVLLQATDLQARAQGGFTTAVTAERLRAMPAHQAN
jgi:hypothetical protein